MKYKDGVAKKLFKFLMFADKLLQVQQGAKNIIIAHKGK